jgi:hypothetical protein
MYAALPELPLLAEPVAVAVRLPVVSAVARVAECSDSSVAGWSGGGFAFWLFVFGAVGEDRRKYRDGARDGQGGAAGGISSGQCTYGVQRRTRAQIVKMGRLEHRVDRLRTLVVVPSIDAACVDLGVLQPVLSSLFDAELKLFEAFFSFFIVSIRYVFNKDLGVAPSVRQDSVGRDRLAAKVCQDQSA